MLRKADSNFAFAVGAALLFFFIGGILTTVVPPLVDKSWSKPFENSDPSQGGDRQAGRLHRTPTERARDLCPRGVLVLPYPTDSYAPGGHGSLRLEGRS